MALGAPSSLSRFDEALRWFLERVVLTDDELDALSAGARTQAFWFADGTQMRMVQDVFDQIVKGLDTGETFAAFKKRVSASLASAWGGANPFRVETIWINAIQRAYNGGRYRQLTKPAVKRFRPFWMYDAIMDSRTSTICKERDSTVLPADDPWWDSNYPPLHHRCRSAVRALTKRQANRKGINSGTGDITEPAQDGFGLSPKEEPLVKPNPRKFDSGVVDESRTKAQQAGIK